MSAQAEVAANQEQLIIAETAVKQAEDRLRLLIFDTDAAATSGTCTLEPIDSPPVGIAGARRRRGGHARAARARRPAARAQGHRERRRRRVKFAGNQRLPDVRAQRQLPGQRPRRHAGAAARADFPGTIVGPGADHDVRIGARVSCSRSDYPTWAVGVSVSYPIGGSARRGQLRARAARARAGASSALKSAEARAIQQVRDAAWKIEMNAKRIETTRAARELAEQRLDAEQKRFEVGMSTSFLVIQAQRDLAQAKTNELSAVLAYDLSLVDFDALQQAGPAASGPISAALPVASALPTGSGATAPRTTSTAPLAARGSLLASCVDQPPKAMADGL